jgi:hypothetical protein
MCRSCAAELKAVTAESRTMAEKIFFKASSRRGLGVVLVETAG